MSIWCKIVNISFYFVQPQSDHIDTGIIYFFLFIFFPLYFLILSDIDEVCI